MLKSFVLVKLAYNAASITLFLNPIYAQIMLVFQNSATFFFQCYARQKMDKTVRKVIFINLLS